jgi:hypothetical protein
VADGPAAAAAAALAGLPPLESPFEEPPSWAVAPAGAAAAAAEEAAAGRKRGLRDFQSPFLSGGQFADDAGSEQQAAPSSLLLQQQQLQQRSLSPENPRRKRARQLLQTVLSQSERRSQGPDHPGPLVIVGAGAEAFSNARARDQSGQPLDLLPVSSGSLEAAALQGEELAQQLSGMALQGAAGQPSEPAAAPVGPGDMDLTPSFEAMFELLPEQLSFGLLMSGVVQEGNRAWQRSRSMTRERARQLQAAEQPPGGGSLRIRREAEATVDEEIEAAADAAAEDVGGALQAEMRGQAPGSMRIMMLPLLPSGATSAEGLLRDAMERLRSGDDLPEGCKVFEVDMGR